MLKMDKLEKLNWWRPSTYQSSNWIWIEEKLSWMINFYYLFQLNQWRRTKDKWSMATYLISGRIKKNGANCRNVPVVRRKTKKWTNRRDQISTKAQPLLHICFSAQVRYKIWDMTDVILRYNGCSATELNITTLAPVLTVLNCSL
jgi:hypothetical protein